MHQAEPGTGGPYAARTAPGDGGGGVAVVLYRPLIPQNTGSVARTCVATGTPLYLVRPFPFSLDETRLKRAGLDYWQHLSLGVVDDLEALSRGGRLVMVSRKGDHAYHEFAYRPTDRLVFGSEDKGLPEALLADATSIFVPMCGSVRSLNLSNVATMVLYRALEALGRPGGPGNPDDPGPARQARPDDRGIAALPRGPVTGGRSNP